MRDMDDIRGVVEAEGLEYALLSYIGRQLNSDDVVLNDVWADAYDALTEIMHCLTPYYCEREDPPVPATEPAEMEGEES